MHSRPAKMSCEKPLAATPEECRVLCDLAPARRILIGWGHIFPLNLVLHLKFDIKRGELGRIYYMNAVRTIWGQFARPSARLQPGEPPISQSSIFFSSFSRGSIRTGAGVSKQNGLRNIGFLTLHVSRNKSFATCTPSLAQSPQGSLAHDRGAAKMALDDMDNLRAHPLFTTKAWWPMPMFVWRISHDPGMERYHSEAQLFEPLLRQNQESSSACAAERAGANGGIRLVGRSRSLRCTRLMSARTHDQCHFVGMSPRIVPIRFVDRVTSRSGNG